MPTKFIDFQEIKKSVVIEDAIPLLGLTLKPSGGAPESQSSFLLNPFRECYRQVRRTGCAVRALTRLTNSSRMAENNPGGSMP